MILMAKIEKKGGAENKAPARIWGQATYDPDGQGRKCTQPYQYFRNHGHITYDPDGQDI